MSSFFSTYVFPSRPTLNYWGESVSLSLAQREPPDNQKEAVGKFIKGNDTWLENLRNKELAPCNRTGYQRREKGYKKREIKEILTGCEAATIM